MAMKARNPYNLSYDDLITWSQDLVDFLNDHSGDVDLTPRAGDFPPLAAAYEDSYHAAISPKQYSPLLHDELEGIAESLIAVLRELRVRIPLLPGVDESTLADFGLGDPVPDDWDKLDAIANVCKDYWQSLGNPPEYAPLSTTMARMVDLATAFESKHSAYRAAIGDKQDAINLRDQRRDALLVCEREIFHWYAAVHPKGTDDWWRTTPWGTTGGGEPSSDIPDAPTGLAYTASTRTFSWDAVDGATSYQLAYSADGEDWSDAYSGAGTSVVFEPGAGDWYFRVRARNDQGYGDWSATLSVHIDEPTHPNPPENLSAEYLPPPDKLVRVQWDAVAGADSYNVYRSVVPLGDPMGELEFVGSVVSAEYDDHDIMTNITIYYSATTVQGALESDKSAPVSVDVAP